MQMLRTPALWLSVILVLCIHLFEMQRKEGVYIDEVFTLMVCSGTFDDSRTAMMEVGSQETGSQLRSRLLDLRGTGNRLVALRNGTNDVMWTNLYYSLAQLTVGEKVLSSKADVMGACRTLWLLNLFVLLLCMLIGWVLLRSVQMSSWLSAVTLLLMFGSPAISMSVLLARGFMLAVLAVMCLSCVWIKLVSRCMEGQRVAWTGWLWFVLSMTFAMLTAYTNLVFIAILLIVQVILSQKGSRLRTSLTVVVCFVLALLLSLAVYPPFFDGLSSDGYVGTPRQLLSHFLPFPMLEKEAYLLWHLHKSVMLKCCALLPLVVLPLLHRRIRMDRQLRPCLCLSLAAWCAVFLCWAVVPYRSLRYVIMFLPEALLLWALMLRSLSVRLKWCAGVVALLLTFGCHVKRGSVELICNPNPLEGKSNIEACSDNEQYFLQCAMLPFAGDGAVITYHPLSHSRQSSSEKNICITTLEPNHPEGLPIHRFLNVVQPTGK